MSDYRSNLPTSHLLYLDCNSLHTTCQTYPLPVGGFRFLTDAELLTFDVAGVPADSPMGYFVECDLPTELHALHNAYPLVPEHVYILEEMLSDTVHLMQDVTGVAHFPCTKLVSNLCNKTRYITHYGCLQFCLAHRLVLDKIHRVIAFTQSTYMLPFIKFCNDGRKNAKSEFESFLYKLIANAFYGKAVDCRSCKICTQHFKSVLQALVDH